MGKEELRSLPSVHQLMESVSARMPEAPPSVLRRVCRESVEEERSRLLAGGEAAGADEVAETALHSLRRALRPTMENVINATGVMLHTAIGRAPMPPAAVEAATAAARGYTVLQWDRESGRRGHRDDHVEGLLTEITGAEAATVVNNNAGATLLVLSALCRGREVVVSRGQLVEIGGAFRIPEVMRQSGAVMREVGCTNRTHIRDYAEALSEETAALLRVHPSNYRIRGFSGFPALSEMVELADSHGLPVIDDLGAGSLVDLSLFGLPHEPTVIDSLGDGASVTTSSGDKLIGGPQAGIITGRKELVDSIRRHPLARALRVDKMTLATLAATLRLFLEDREYIVEHHPVYAMFAASSESLEERAAGLLEKLELPDGCSAEVIHTDSYVGSGSLPDTAIPSFGVAVGAPDPDALARSLRTGSPAVASRVEDGVLKLDVRTLQAGETDTLAGLVSREAAELWA
jgi:L-seryl-tRNA(Ser) seleniumtransferase